MNLTKEKYLYRQFVDSLEKSSNGEAVDRMEIILDRAFILFLGGDFRPVYYPTSDFLAKNIKDLSEYCETLKHRRKIDIEGGEREVTTEKDAFDSLVLANSLARNLVMPFVHVSNQFTNRIFNDIYNLSLSYVEAICSGVADEYIDQKKSPEAKLEAVELARQGIDIKKIYDTNRLSPNLQTEFKSLDNLIKFAHPEFMRPFELVATSRKKIYKKKELTEKIRPDLTRTDAQGKLLFYPSVIFPIANGGIELGIELSIAYDKLTEREPIVYPLMFSMKTRKQRYPWTQNDTDFLSQSLENSDVLITEDWVTTGNTLRGILQKIEDTYPREIRIATWKRDPEKSKIPILDKYKFYVGSWSTYIGGKTDSLKDMELSQ